MTPQEILKIEQDIILALKNIYDPEIPVNIYDLGLIYQVELTPERVAVILMTLTAPNCPMADELLNQVNGDVAMVEGVDKVELTLTFEPQWDRSHISEEALLELGLM
ncbi:MAG: iron-sulfur cluster assembly protein [Mucinivorans sp.]